LPESVGLALAKAEECAHSLPLALHVNGFVLDSLDVQGTGNAALLALDQSLA